MKTLLLCANCTIIPFLFQRDYKCLGEGNILVITPLLPRIQGSIKILIPGLYHRLILLNRPTCSARHSEIIKTIFGVEPIISPLSITHDHSKNSTG